MATATATAQQSNSIAVRSIDIAERDHLVGTAVRRADDPAGRATFTVPSRSYTGVIDRVYLSSGDVGPVPRSSDLHVRRPCLRAPLRPCRRRAAVYRALHAAPSHASGSL